MKFVLKKFVVQKFVHNKFVIIKFVIARFVIIKFIIGIGLTTQITSFSKHGDFVLVLILSISEKKSFRK